MLQKKKKKTETPLNTGEQGESKPFWQNHYFEFPDRAIFDQGQTANSQNLERTPTKIIPGTFSPM